jgi:hypothetical protein
MKVGEKPKDPSVLTWCLATYNLIFFVSTICYLSLVAERPSMLMQASWITVTDKRVDANRAVMIPLLILTWNWIACVATLFYLAQENPSSETAKFCGCSFSLNWCIRVVACCVAFFAFGWDVLTAHTVSWTVVFFLAYCVVGYYVSTTALMYFPLYAVWLVVTSHVHDLLGYSREELFSTVLVYIYVAVTLLCLVAAATPEINNNKTDLLTIVLGILITVIPLRASVVNVQDTTESTNTYYMTEIAFHLAVFMPVLQINTWSKMIDSTGFLVQFLIEAAVRTLVTSALLVDIVQMNKTNTY